MSGANYEWCPGCEQKALYVGEEDVPDGVEVWHAECRAKAEASAAAGAASAQRELIRQRLGESAERARLLREAYEVLDDHPDVLAAFRRLEADLASLIGSDQP